MKKTWAIVSLLCYLCGIFGYTLLANADATDTYFVVTAYYSPLPNQSIYLKGDYEKEKILNGEWVKGASGKWVFSGMLAAPKGYNFGTKIYIEWLWIGSVEDRGGAIVPAGQRWHKYDRIDVWMGYGEDGLKRALAWGKRTVKWKIVSSNSQTSIDVSNISFPKSINVPYYGKKITENIFNTSLGKDSNTILVKDLQQQLKEVELYDGPIDGVYNPKLINAIYEFQTEYDIVSNPDDAGAGYWWIKTRKKFTTLKNSGFFDVNIVQTPQQVWENDIFKTYIHPQSNSDVVKKLQKVLSELGYYSWEENGKYNDIYDILVNYQIENKIISSKNDLAAGYFWPKTRATMWDEYKQMLEKKAKEEEYKNLVTKLEAEKLEEAKKMIEELWNVRYGETSARVRELQILLKDLGYFDYQDTAIFGKITKDSVIKYQIDNEIISSETESVAWLIWPKTKASFAQDMAAMLLEEELAKISKDFEVAVK